MAKGYWIGRVDVKNDEGYKPYAAANAGIFKKFGGRFVVRAAASSNASKATRARATWCIEFPTMRPRSPATARRNIRRTSSCGSRMRPRISSLSRATTARSRKWRF